jgi:hypothetical protein
MGATMFDYDDPTLALLLLQPVDLGDVTQAFAFEGCGESGAGRGLSLRSAPCSTTDYSGGGESDEFEHSVSDGGSGDTGGGDLIVTHSTSGDQTGGSSGSTGSGSTGSGSTGSGSTGSGSDAGGSEEYILVIGQRLPQTPLDPNPFPLTPPPQQTSAPPTSPTAADQGFSTDPPSTCYSHDLNGDPISQLTVPGFSAASPSLAQLNALVERAVEIRNTSALTGATAAVAGAVVGGIFGGAAAGATGQTLARLYLFAEEYNLDPLIGRVPGLDQFVSGDGLIPGASFDTKWYDSVQGLNIPVREANQDVDVNYFEPVGNFLFGYLGRVAGLSEFEIRAAANLTSSTGQDTARDAAIVTAGINYYNSVGSAGFNSSQLGAPPC